MKLVPELLCSNIDATKDFYCRILGFNIAYERPEEKFAYFNKNGIEIMVEQFDAPGRHWITAKLETPFGRGINFQCEVSDIEQFYTKVKTLAPKAIYLEMETKTYQCGDKLIPQKQFLVQDLDGYLFRFCEEEQAPL